MSEMNVSRRGLFGWFAALPFVGGVAAVESAPVAAIEMNDIGAAADHWADALNDDLSDVIYNIAPQETPFLSAVELRARGRIDWTQDFPIDD